MRITIISLILAVFCFSGWAQDDSPLGDSNQRDVPEPPPDTAVVTQAEPDQAAGESEDRIQWGVWLLAGIMIAIQVAFAVGWRSEFPFDWPKGFRILGSLSFAVFALISAKAMLTDDWKGRVTGTEVFYLLLTPFVGFISCYLTAHVLETFNEIKKNTDKLQESD